ncbi:hypothetical protein TNCV_1319881 [Trichonephila clavipes]|nr:hypothetical protein TNCV_1319881 [Trichonephila clavipes]
MRSDIYCRQVATFSSTAATAQQRNRKPDVSLKGTCGSQVTGPARLGKMMGDHFVISLELALQWVEEHHPKSEGIRLRSEQ